MNKTKLLSIALLLFPTIVLGQQPAVDTSIRKGKLDNGLTYYIRHNAKEANIADFYIAQRVGSILEEPRQRGLAHFLEHMAFNGTEHFRGDGTSLGIVPWCETIGVKFGANLNAYTSVDQTVYNISAVPVSREGVVDSCLLILHDWSHSLLLTDKEIDKERGVIHEEWRTRRAGMAVQRLMERALPTIYRGTKYEDCLPIGSMDVVDNFSYDALRDYYKKWYRPDLQAIIVVGDIDVDVIENKIKQLFSAIPKPVNPEERVYYPVSDNKDMIVAIEKDAEQPIVLTRLYMKREATPDSEKATEGYQRDGYIDWIITYVLNQRIQELQHSDNPPFISASVHSGRFFVSRTKDAFSIQIGCKENDITGSIAAVMAETERARQHGFTEAELERAKAVYLKGAERRYAERNDRKNSYYVSKSLNNFLDAEPMLSEQTDLELAKKFDESVTLAEVNNAIGTIITDKNQVLTVYAPDKEGVVIPDASVFEQTILKAQSLAYEPYKEDNVSSELMAVKPKGGSIVSEKDYGKHDIKQLKLSNGMEVYVKHTDFNADQVIMQIFAEGGTSVYPDADVPNFSFISSAIAEAGVADFDAFTLRKKLAGKIVRLSPYVGEQTQGINGSCSVADVETMLQLANLYFTSPRTDDKAFNSLMDRRREMVKNREANPSVTYNDSVSRVLYGDSPRVQPITLDVLDKVDYARVRQIYGERFSDASNFKCIIIGNVDMEKLRPLLSTYLASLPSTGKGEKAADTYPAIRNANETHVFAKKQATPSALVSIYYTADLPFTPETDLKLDVLKRVLQIAYTDSVREEKGGTYGVSVSFDLDNHSKPDALLKISYRTDPQRYEELTPIVYQQLRNIAENGPSSTSLDKVKKYLVKAYAQNAITNDYWKYVMYNMTYRNVDFHTGYEAIVESITADDIKNIATEILRQNRRLEITMKSE